MRVCNVAWTSAAAFKRAETAEEYEGAVQGITPAGAPLSQKMGAPP